MLRLKWTALLGRRLVARALASRFCSSAARQPAPAALPKTASEANFCKGCGCRLQTVSPFEEGYIDPTHLQQELDKVRKAREALEPESRVEVERYLQYYQKAPAVEPAAQEEAENIDPLASDETSAVDALDEKFFSRFWQKRYVKGINCLRCVKLKQGDVFAFGKDVEKIRSVSRAELVRKLARQINFGAFALLVLDVSDLGGSWVEELVELINEKSLQCLVVVNKADTIPPNANSEVFRQRLVSFLNKQPTRLKSLSEKRLFLVSARSGHGIAKLCAELKRLSAESTVVEGRRRVYVLGSVNSGKSSLINAFWQHFKAEMKLAQKPRAPARPLRRGLRAAAAGRAREEEPRPRGEDGADGLRAAGNDPGPAPRDHPALSLPRLRHARPAQLRAAHQPAAGHRPDQRGRQAAQRLPAAGRDVPGPGAVGWRRRPHRPSLG